MGPFQRYVKMIKSCRIILLMRRSNTLFVLLAIITFFCVILPPLISYVCKTFQNSTLYKATWNVIFGDTPVILPIFMLKHYHCYCSML